MVFAIVQNFTFVLRHGDLGLHVWVPHRVAGKVQWMQLTPSFFVDFVQRLLRNPTAEHILTIHAVFFRGIVSSLERLKDQMWQAEPLIVKQGNPKQMIASEISQVEQSRPSLADASKWTRYFDNKIGTQVMPDDAWHVATSACMLI